MSPARKGFKISSGFIWSIGFQEKPTAQSHRSVSTENECIFVTHSYGLRLFPGDAANKVPR